MILGCLALGYLGFMVAQAKKEEKISDTHAFRQVCL